VAFVLPGHLTRLRCEFDVASPAATSPPDHQATFLVFLRATLPSGSETAFWLGGVRYDAPTSFNLNEEYLVADGGADDGGGHFSGEVVVKTNFRQDGAYIHVIFELDGASRTQTLDVGGMKNSGPSHFPTNTDSLVVELGNQAFRPVLPFALHFDNFVCDKP
jgi:hypothetical protein